MGTVFELTSDYSVQEATTPDALDALHADWLNLWERCPGTTPFQSPDWLIPFWRHVGEGELLVVTLRHEERLVMVAPFVINARLGTATREVFLLGTGVTDYLDILIEPGSETVAMAAVFQSLHSRSDRWDVLDFHQLRSGSPLLNSEGPGGWITHIHVQEVCPVLALPREATGLPHVVPGHMLAKLDHYRRRLAKLGFADFEAARENNFSELFERFLVLHHARWQSRGVNGVLASEGLQRFHAEAAERFLHSGCLRLYGLRLDGQLIAALCSFLHQGRAYYYLGGFDAEFSALSPGTLLIGHALDQAIAAGCSEFDFLRGREAYKYMWGAKGRLNYRRQFFRNDVPARA